MNINLKLAIFDLDKTLWDGKSLYRDTTKTLDWLKKQNVRLYVASHHKNAQECCKKLNINHYFNGIFYGQSNKSQFVDKILRSNRDIDKEQIAFFDDSFRNLIDVRMNNEIKTIHVDKSRGVTMTDIIRPFNISGKSL
jgi:HAD superfamily phosphatase (TIGR01681 family)